MIRPLAAAVLLAATAAGAQSPPMARPGAPDARRVTAGTYKVDPYHTMAVWTVDHMGFTPYSGIFSDIEGTLTLDPKRPSAATIAVTIPVARITTPNADLTKHLLGKDFFGEAPAAARFVSRRVTVSGERASIAGELTLNGITRPLVLDAKFYGAGALPKEMGAGEGLGFTATATLKRSDFGLGYGVPIVSDAVELRIFAGFVKDQAAR